MGKSEVSSRIVGDMVMALYGAPLDDVDHADHAVELLLGEIQEGHDRLDGGIGHRDVDAPPFRVEGAEAGSHRGRVGQRRAGVEKRERGFPGPRVAGGVRLRGSAVLWGKVPQPEPTLSDIQSRISAALADHYRIERELGSGGMATVYLAEDLRHRRKVAVKVLRPELAVTLGSDRFLREIETAAQFQHPHILPLLDSGEAGGFLYYVMPYVEGESLRSRLTRRGELPIHDAVKILVEVCDALAYAHAHGVVHRDIKPDNVLLSGRHALVTDFGVAKALSEATGRQQFTTAGVALGTPAYMAPEQAAAEHAARTQVMFNKMDTDHDGYLLRAEMEAGHAMMKSP